MSTSTTRSRIIALARTDLQVAARDGEQLLLTLGLPILLLVFFSKVDIVPTGDGEAVDFLAPGIISLALLSVAFVRLAIGLGFDRGFGAIKRLAITPLRVNEFLVAKLATTVVLFGVQLVLLAAIAVAIGWRPQVSLSAPVVIMLGLVAFTGLAFIVASIVEGLTSLALANALYIILLLLSGLVFDIEKMPGWLQAIVKLLPSTALAELLRSGFSATPGAAWAWLCLTLWAIATPLLAARLFRWE
jgi:ABC-2 type transport system permease protein